MADNACTTWDAVRRRLPVAQPVRRPGLASNLRTLRGEHRRGVGLPRCTRRIENGVRLAPRRRHGRGGVGIGLREHAFGIRLRPCQQFLSDGGEWIDRVSYRGHGYDRMTTVNGSSFAVRASPRVRAAREVKMTT